MKMTDEYGMTEGGIVVCIVAGVMVAITLVAAIFAWPFAKTPADKIALSYGGGPFEGAAFQRVVQPGSGLVLNGLMDKWYEYPVTQRNYIVSLNKDEGDRGVEDQIHAASSDGVAIGWELASYFKLNTGLIRQFHETLGLKYHAWSTSGWDKMLNDTLRQQLENAVQISSKQFTAEQIYKDSTVIQKVQDDIASSLKDSVNHSVGAAFFCGPTFDRRHPEVCPDFQVVVKKPTLPQSVIDQYNNQKASELGIQVAKNNADAKVKEAAGVKEQQAALAQSVTPEYLDLLRAQAMQACASNPNCTLVITQGGTGVNVNTK